MIRFSTTYGIHLSHPQSDYNYKIPSTLILHSAFNYKFRFKGQQKRNSVAKRHTPRGENVTLFDLEQIKVANTEDIAGLSFPSYSVWAVLQVGSARTNPLRHPTLLYAKPVRRRTHVAELPFLFQSNYRGRARFHRLARGASARPNYQRCKMTIASCRLSNSGRRGTWQFAF
jgi:hypothetical protein